MMALFISCKSTKPKLNSSEVLIFTYQEDQRWDILFGSVFLGENSILRGRFRLMFVTDLLKLIVE
jgi:hypothetical protein